MADVLALDIKGLKKTYPNGFEALKGIDLSVGEGEFFALLVRVRSSISWPGW